jgi:hypothetical protein
LKNIDFMEGVTKKLYDLCELMKMLVLSPTVHTTFNTFVIILTVWMSASNETQGDALAQV